MPVPGMKALAARTVRIGQDSLCFDIVIDNAHQPVFLLRESEKQRRGMTLMNWQWLGTL
ncbi:hypothetical protein ACWF50_11560 [Brucella pseudogrignonensis]